MNLKSTLIVCAALLAACFAPLAPAWAEGIEKTNGGKCGKSCELPRFGPFEWSWESWGLWTNFEDWPPMPEVGDFGYSPGGFRPLDGDIWFDGSIGSHGHIIHEVVEVEIDEASGQWRSRTLNSVYGLVPPSLNALDPWSWPELPECLRNLNNRYFSAGSGPGRWNASSLKTGGTEVEMPATSNALPGWEGGCSSCTNSFGVSGPGDFQLSIGLGGNSMGGLSMAGALDFSANLAEVHELSLDQLGFHNLLGSTSGTLASGAVTVLDRGGQVMSTLQVQTTPATAPAAGLQAIVVTVTPVAEAGRPVTTHRFEKVSAAGADFTGEGVRYTRTEGAESEALEFYNSGAGSTGVAADGTVWGTFKTVDTNGDVTIWTTMPESAAITWNGGQWQGDLMELHEFIPAAAGQPSVRTERHYARIGNESLTESAKVLRWETVTTRLGGVVLAEETTRYGHYEAYHQPGGTIADARFGQERWQVSASGEWTLTLRGHVPDAAVPEVVETLQITPWLDGPGGTGNLTTQAGAEAFFAALAAQATGAAPQIAGCRITRTHDNHEPNYNLWPPLPWAQRDISLINGVVTGTTYEFDQLLGNFFALDEATWLFPKSRTERWSGAGTQSAWSARFALDDAGTLDASVDHSGIVTLSTQETASGGATTTDTWRTLLIETPTEWNPLPDYAPGEAHPLWSTTTTDAEGRVVAEASRFGTGGSGTTIQTITTSYSGETGSTRSAGGVTLGSQGEDVIANGQRTATSTDAQGVTTTTVTDEATGEMISETRLGVTTNYAKTTATNGNTTQTVTQTAGGATRTLSVIVTDAQGRTVSSTDANGGETTYAYANHGRTVTETLPGGLTRITQTYLDGQLQSITGTAGVAEYHSYTVNSGSAAYEAGSITETTHYGTSDGAHWRKVTTNFLGQVLREEEPSPAGAVSVTTHEYNAKGQRIKTSRTGVADMIVEYDDWGRVAKQGYDVSGDNALTVNSNDVLSTSSTDYIQAQGTVLERVVRTQYTQDGSATGALQTTTERKLLEGSQWQRVTQADGSVLTQWDEMNGGTRIEHAQQVNGAVSLTQTRTYQNGALVSETQPGMSQPITYQSNALGEITQIVHPLSGTITRTYDAQGRVITQSQSGGGTETYAYNAQGQVASITHADNSTTTYTYDAQGRQTSQGGTAGYALGYEYDAMGRLWKLHTTRGSSDDVTTWEYVPGTNALASKTDAAGRSVTYTYDAAGRQQTRAWQRGVVTTYSYDGVGWLTGIDYSDNTPDVTHAYDRAGRRISTTDAAGTHTFTYDAASGGQLATWSVGSSGVWSGLSVAHTYSSGQRSSRATSLGGITLPTASYAYDAASGRMASVSADGVTASYRYNAATGWNEGVTYSSGLSSTRTMDALGRLDAITWSAGGTVVSGHDYTLNAMHRRTAAQRQDGSRWTYGYNDRGEVTNAAKQDYAGIPEPGKQFAFAFDGLGNRTSSSVSSLGDDQITRTTSYSANELNQYTQITHPSPGWLVLRGSANTAATVTIDGEPPLARYGPLWFHEQSVDNSSGAVRRIAEITATRPDGGLNNGPVSTKRKGAMFIPPPVESPTHDLDGNQTSDARWNYAWDGENRMIVAEEKVIPVTVATGATAPTTTTRQKIEFAYDSMNRRLTKKVYEQTTTNGTPGSFALKQSLVYLYDQWNMIAEIDITSNARLLKTFEWGLDVSGTMDGAGGVGGLLIERFYSAPSTNSSLPSPGAYAPCFDGNGNVTELINLATNTLGARYEYGPFGESITVDGGTLAEANPFRFSTKYLDGETGLIDYLNRIYRPCDGRWQSKDPIGEWGGVNLYGMVSNNAVSYVDYLGWANYSLGSPKEPPMPSLDRDTFPYDPNAKPTAGDRASWLKWAGFVNASETWLNLPDANRAYRHYRGGSGTDLEIDYGKAYSEDKVVRTFVDNEIAAAQRDAEKLWNGKDLAFEMTGLAASVNQDPATENWTKTIGRHLIWGSATVIPCANPDQEWTMLIIIREKDRYNFNPGAKDIATGLPDDANGRFATLGWAKSFITNGKIFKLVKWKKGNIPKTTHTGSSNRRD